MKKIHLPYCFEPRSYQLQVFVGMDRGVKRFVLLWHRRAGKDKTCLNAMVMATQMRIGTYFYFLPTYSQAKKVIWDGMDAKGFPFLKHFPPDLWEGDPNTTELKLRLKNGSVFQLVGSDSIDNIVGTNPVGCVFSEYALQDPKGWEYVRPILLENGGWAMFPYTPRGKNHGYDLYEMARNNPSWHVSSLTIRETGVLTEADIQAERDAGMPEELVQQEYYCSFEGGMQGAYYADALRRAEAEGRIGQVPHDPALTVDTWWDLGVADSTTIWFVQEHYTQTRVIDYYEASGEGLDHYAKVLDRKPYKYKDHVAPHDIGVRELGSGRSRQEVAQDLGIYFRVAAKLPIQDGIQAVRMLLPRCWFDVGRCKQGLNALRDYHKVYDDKRGDFSDRPHKDWTNHAADGFRTGAVGRREAKVPEHPDRYARKRHAQVRSWMSW